MDGRRAIKINDFTTFPLVQARTARAGERCGEVGYLLPRRWAWFAALVGPAVAILCIALEPPPAQPDAAAPLLGVLLSSALFASWAGAAVRAGQRHRGALVWASVVGLLSVAMTLTCPASGHHAGVGAWWFGQLGISGAALTIAVAAAFASRRRPLPTRAPAQADDQP